MLKADSLKKSILSLAMQGKLVPQLDTEEPASELLKQIESEKQAQIASGKIKKQKPLDPITEDEIPFEIPNTWQWVRLGEIFNIINGFTPLKSNEDFWNKKEINWFTIKDIPLNRIVESTEEFISNIALGKSSTRIAPKNSLLLCCTASIGEYALSKIPLTTNQQFNAIYPKKECEKLIEMKYIFNIAPMFKQYLIDIAGKTTFYFISTSKVSLMPIALPPLEEQKRIVAKIEELMPLVDEYSILEKELEGIESSLAGKLKKSILNLAIQGKLVPQLDTEEPASELLKQIESEKQSQIASGKIKKQKPLDPITEDEIPFEIPNTWQWTRLGVITNLICDGTHATPNYISNGVKFLSIQNISSGKLDLSKIKYISQKDHEVLIKRAKPEVNDILLCRIGTLGRPLVIDFDFDFSIFVSLCLIKSNIYTCPKFIKLLLESAYMDIVFDKIKVGGGTHTNKLNLGDIANIEIPLPPLEEQYRIVAKIEELFKLIDDLK